MNKTVLKSDFSLPLAESPAFKSLFGSAYTFQFILLLHVDGCFEAQQS
jgi:hypothetical protein